MHPKSKMQDQTERNASEFDQMVDSLVSEQRPFLLQRSAPERASDVYNPAPELVVAEIRDTGNWKYEDSTTSQASRIMKDLTARSAQFKE